jgi:WS/DGAT/MGAT family acyltransferase
VIAKIHPAVMDGMHLAALLGDLLDRSPVVSLERSAPEPWLPDPEPALVRLALESTMTLARKPRKVIRAAADVTRAIARSQTSSSHSARPTHQKRRLEVPPTPWRGAISARRVAAFADAPLADLRAIGERYGATINDVVLAASAGTLRRWLLDHRALPAIPLVGNVPIAVKRAGERAGNQISLLRVSLFTDEPDPVARLHGIRQQTRRSKAQHHARGSNAYVRLAELVLGVTVPALLTRAVAFYSSHRGADFHPALWNVVISNVPGPQYDLFCAGARVTRIYPYGPVQHGSGLNLTVMSTADRLCLGVLACPEKVPDVDAVATGFVEEVELLRRSLS